LNNEDHAPADIALLDCNESYCLVETKLIDGKNDLTLKYPLKSTKSNKIL